MLVDKLIKPIYIHVDIMIRLVAVIALQRKSTRTHSLLSSLMTYLHRVLILNHIRHVHDYLYIHVSEPYQPDQHAGVLLSVNINLNPAAVSFNFHHPQVVHGEYDKPLCHSNKCGHAPPLLYSTYTHINITCTRC